MGVHEINRDRASGWHPGKRQPRGSTRILVSAIVMGPCRLYGNRASLQLAQLDPDGNLKAADPLPGAARRACPLGVAPEEEGGEEGIGDQGSGGYLPISEAGEGEHILELLVCWAVGEQQHVLPDSLLDRLLEPLPDGGFRHLTMHESHLKALGIPEGSFRGDGEFTILGVVEGEKTVWMLALLKVADQRAIVAAERGGHENA
ncbi:MAG: hypothetical protein HY825_20060 [Acidobacteria bacterium]|nr:hypothetical protein [Acidobacteriota bacterium]